MGTLEKEGNSGFILAMAVVTTHVFRALARDFTQPPVGPGPGLEDRDGTPYGYWGTWGIFPNSGCGIGVYYFTYSSASCHDASSTPNLAPKARASASSEAPRSGAARAGDGDAATSWRATSSGDQWLQLDFAGPTTINEFKIKEDPSSSVIRYVIQCWDDNTSRWVGCFNGRNIGPDFVAPIVARTTRKVRLFVMKTTSGNPCIAEFEAYNDTTGGLKTWLVVWAERCQQREIERLHEEC